jgi:hypothetical protein
MTTVLSGAQLDATAASIAEIQLGDGMIPWFPGGHADPWNHVEACMALAHRGMVGEAVRGYQWLAATQQPDGSWCTYYVADGVEEPRRDPNVCAYVATGVWQHLLVTGDRGFAGWAWPMVERAIDFTLSLQTDGGEVIWSLDPDGTPGRFALLTGSSSMLHSIRCALALADALGRERPDWELAAGRLSHAVAFRPDAFEPKDRWAMDWYYPVLSGALAGEAAVARMRLRYETFVMEGRGVRCVSDRPWVTTAETSECVMALDAAGLRDEAAQLFGWIQQQRHEDGSYWTGCVYPQEVHFPGGERSTYSAAAVVLAAHALQGSGPADGLFRGDTLPSIPALEPEGSAVPR